MMLTLEYEPHAGDVEVFAKTPKLEHLGINNTSVTGMQ